MPLILLGGINNLSTVQLAIDEGFDFVAIGRALLREPDLVKRWEEGMMLMGHVSIAISACQYLSGYALLDCA